MVHTRLVAPPSEAAPEAAVDPAVEAAVELESLPPQAARAAAPATTALAFRNERREIFLMIFASWKSSFSSSKPAGGWPPYACPTTYTIKQAAPFRNGKSKKSFVNFSDFKQNL